MKKITLLIALMLGSFVFSQNIITNGDFESGTTGWSGNALNVVTENNNSYNSANVTAAGNPWDVNLSYVFPVTTQGTAYQLTFDAWSDVARPLIAGIGLNQDPWTNTTQIVNLTTTSQTFTLNFISNFASPTSRIIFDMGNAVGFVGIDNVVLEVVTTTCNNGVQDGDETGVDCGGSCPACVPVPTVAAPTPPARPVADVVSIYSDAYANISMDNFDAGWCGGAATTEVQIAGNNTLKKNTGVVCHGIDFQTNRQNLTTFTHIHFDFYITDTDLTGDVFNLKLVDFAGGSGEASALEININGGSTPQLVANQWVSVDVPITALGGVIAGNLNRSDVAQIGITTAMVDNVWYDNIYLHKNTVLSNESFTASKVNMYPNPSNNVVNINSIDTIDSVIIMNVLGQTVMTKEVNSNNFTLDISELNPGQYFMSLISNGVKVSKKLIKN